MLIKQDFYFRSLDARRPLHIRVPDTGEPPSPVMYFLDGHNLFRDEDATYGKCWGLDGYLSSWNKSIIVVGVECTHEGDLRLSEYLPYPSAYGFLKGIVPRGEAAMEGIIRELKPWVDASFPTIPFRECTGIGGSSMGGLMAAFALVRYNRYVSKAACLSPSLGTVSGRLWHEMNASPLSPDSRIYLSLGTDEGFGRRRDALGGMLRTLRITADKVKSAGGSAMIFLQEGGRHCEADWEKQNGLYMPFLWQG